MKARLAIVATMLLLIASINCGAVIPVKEDLRAEIKNSQSVAIYRVAATKCLEWLTGNGCKRAEFRFLLVKGIKGKQGKETVIVNSGSSAGTLPLGSLVLGYENSFGNNRNNARQTFILLPIADVNIDGVDERLVILGEDERARDAKRVGLYEEDPQTRKKIIFNENTGRSIRWVAPLEGLL